MNRSTWSAHVDWLLTDDKQPPLAARPGNNAFCYRGAFLLINAALRWRQQTSCVPLRDTVFKHCVGKQSCASLCTIHTEQVILVQMYINLTGVPDDMLFPCWLHPCGASPPQQLHVARWAAQRGAWCLTVTTLQNILINNSNTSPLLFLPLFKPTLCLLPASIF